MEGEFLSVAQLAALLGVTPATIYGLRYRGEGPPGARVGRELRFRRFDVEQWHEQRVKPTKGP